MTKKRFISLCPQHIIIILPFFLLKRNIYYDYKEKKK